MRRGLHASRPTRHVQVSALPFRRPPGHNASAARLKILTIPRSVLAAAGLMAFCMTEPASADSGGLARQCVPPADRLKLITAEEAQWPAYSGTLPEPRRSLFPGPGISAFAPSESKLAFPVSLTIELKPYAGAGINLDSLEVTYLRTPSKDLKPYICDSLSEKARKVLSFQIRGAELPPGKHWIHVRVRDTRGLVSEKYLYLEVAQARGVLMWSWQLLSPPSVPAFVGRLNDIFS